jgi:hypothetical protein
MLDYWLTGWFNLLKMMPESSIILGSSDDRIQLVRGCPCMREFGGERVCINHDEVSSIKPITIDPLFFAQLGTIDDLEGYASEKTSLCYSLINLDPRSGTAFCVSQGREITLHNHVIRNCDIIDALSFVTASQMGNDEMICSTCLYKYLVTMTDVFEDILSEKERAEIIVKYSRGMVDRIAEEIIQDYHCGQISGSYEQVVVDSNLRSVIEDRYGLATLSMHTNLQPKNEQVENLLECYRNLIKLETVFLHQSSLIKNEEDELGIITQLKIMVGTAKKMLSLHDDIRDASNLIIEENSFPPDLKERLEQAEDRRRRAEKHFRNLLSLLSEAAVRPARKLL